MCLRVRYTYNKMSIQTLRSRILQNFYLVYVIYVIYILYIIIYRNLIVSYLLVLYIIYLYLNLYVLDGRFETYKVYNPSFFDLRT